MALTDREEWLCEAACCLWEEVLRILNKPDHPNWAKVNAAREGEGMSAFRLNVISEWVEACNEDYRVAVETGYDDCFDWDFVPDWIAKRIATWKE